MASEIRVNKIINRSGLSTVTFSDTGAIVSGIVTANSFSGNVTGAVTGSGANLTSIPAGQLTGTVADARLTSVTASKLSGALPALDGSALTGINTAFGSGTSVNTSGIITATAFVSDTPLSHRNIIINGAMNVAQRGTSFAAPADGYTLDRWSVYENLSTGQVAVTQEAVTDLIGFTKAAKINTTTAEAGVPSASGAQYATYIQPIEAQNLSHIGNGTSAAKPLTFSFYVKSNVTGTFCVTFYKSDNTARLVSLPYTINSANTWERKTLSIPADTSGGGINDDNGQGIGVYFILARKTGYSGTTSTSWINYTNTGWAPTCTATIFENVNDHMFITGCQLEVGSVATPFEHRSFGDELHRCQRYYQVLVDNGNAKSFGNATAYNSTSLHFVTPLRPEMRTTPTLDYTTGTDYYGAYQNNTVDYFNTFALVGNSHKRSVDLMASSGVSITAAASVLLRTTQNDSKIRFTAEL